MSVGKGSLLRAAGITAGSNTRKEAASSGDMEKGKHPEPVAMKTKEPRNFTIGEPQLMFIPAHQLREIPDEWRGNSYVRPNVSLLAESISRVGILEPIPAVRTEEQVYQLVGGSRRMEVVRMLGIEQVPVLVLPGDDMEAARRIYMELRSFSDAAGDTMHNAKSRTAALFGSQRIPEYLL